MDQNELNLEDSGVQAGIFTAGQYDPRLDQWKSASFDPRALWDRLDGDADLLRELVEIFSEEYPGLLQGIAAAIEQQSYEDLRKISHKLKGSALQFSGTAAVALAASLEQMGKEQALNGAKEVFANLQKEMALLIRSLQIIAASKAE